MLTVGPGTVVLITGASGGVGRATARACAERGASVALLARGAEGLEATRREVEARGGRALSLPTDVRSVDQIEAAAARTERELGPIELWINSAMLSMYGSFADMTPEEFRHIVEVTFLGVVHGTHVALKRMRQRDRGVIVQVGSALAFRSIPLQSAYCASKHAVQGFTESLRSELIHDKSQVRLSVVNMPALNTTQFTWTKTKLPRKARPPGTVYQPEVAADAILFAAEHARRVMMVGHTTIEATLGEKLIPGLLDHYLAKAAWDGVMLPAPVDPTEPDNFWQPVPRDVGSHGAFDAEARDYSITLWLSKRRRKLLAGLMLAAGGLAALLLSKRSSGS